jgi:hypothetical protein
LRYIRQYTKDDVHFWPFDGWSVPPNRSVVAEVYPALWSRSFSTEGRTPEQHDVLPISSWMQLTDADGSLEKFLWAKIEPHEPKKVEIEGWILGVL